MTSNGLSSLDRPTVMSGRGAGSEPRTGRNATELLRVPRRRDRRRSREVIETAGGVAAEVKSRLNVVDVVGETVQLRKAGTTYKGLCPFHGEKTPSFTVTPSRESWKCFGCGLGGGNFHLVMERAGGPVSRGP